jgi:hypothetical protein
MPARPDDEDPVDKRKHYEEICHPKCKSQWDQYQACASRVAKLPEGSEANVRELTTTHSTDTKASLQNFLLTLSVFPKLTSQFLDSVPAPTTTTGIAVTNA